MRWRAANNSAAREAGPAASGGQSTSARKKLLRDTLSNTGRSKALFRRSILSLIHISEPTRRYAISYAVCSEILTNHNVSDALAMAYDRFQPL